MLILDLGNKRTKNQYDTQKENRKTGNQSNTLRLRHVGCLHFNDLHSYSKFIQ